MIIDPSSQQEFSDADFAVVDNGDQSKKLKFQVSGLTTATTRTWTAPDSDLTISAFMAAALGDTSLAAFLATIGLRLNLGTIADDAVASAAVPAAGTYIGFVTSTLNNTASMFLFRSTTAAAPFGMAVTGAGITIDYSASVLAGTTGTDGRITVGNPGTGTIYVENRRGNSLGLTTLHLLGPA